MECLECERLEAERECLKRVYELTLLNLSAAASADDRQLASLQLLAVEAKNDLDIVEAEIANHRDGHARGD